MFDDEGCKRLLLRHFHVNTLIGLGIEDFPVGMIAAGALLSYLYDTQKTELTHFTHLYPYLTSKYMLLDSSTRRNLEPCGKSRSGDPCSGYWTNAARQWAPDCSAAVSSSP